MRHSALSRHLLVIDEVHASDPYMLEIVRSLVHRHLSVGGHALLMSATLGEVLRAELERRRRRPLVQAVAVPYPAVNTLPVTAPSASSSLRLAGYDPALDDVKLCVWNGGCPLVIRSTVDSATRTYQELIAAGVPAMLHHSRFADLDRQHLDAELVGRIGKGGSRLPLAIVATQTAEQSLDIDADLLVSDPAPADVLIQRRGRLGRHRPALVLPMIVIEPTHIAATVAAAHRLAGGQRERMPVGSEWAYVYDPLATLVTVEALRQRDYLRVPDDVRWLVETATHPESLEAFAARNGWSHVWQATWGTRLAQRQLAQGGLIDWSRPYAEQPVSEAVPTRLGNTRVTVELSTPIPSPPGVGPIEALPVPWHWLRDEPPGTLGVPTADGSNGYSILVGRVRLTYGRLGLRR
jgi:CRISPR-associated endonuclease/helicase Cas3